MSNKPPRPRKSRTQKEAAAIGPGTVIYNIAQATGEMPRDVEAAIVTLVSAGNEFDVVWEWMKEAINDGKGIVEMAAERLMSPN